MKCSEIVAEDLDEGWKSALATGALAAATAFGGGTAQAKDTAPATADPLATLIAQKQQQEEDPIGNLIQRLSDKDQQTISQVKQRIKAVKPAAVKTSAHKAAPKPYQPVTGSKLETVLHSFAVKMGLKGTELAAFMGQTAHESDNFKTTKEYSSGQQYEGRKDLGNVHPGDGVKYKGRGFIQITGRYNYTQAAKDLGIDLVNHPELAERPDVAAKVTWWYWKNRVRPNVGNFENVKQVTKTINPGLRGLEKRKTATKDFKLAQR